MRRKILRISPELLVAFLKDPAPPGISASGMPGDAKITLHRGMSGPFPCTLIVKRLI